MDFDSIITILVAIISLSLGFLVLISGYKNISNKLFFAFNLFTSIWIFSSLVAKYSSINTVQPYVNLGFAAASLLVYFFMMFCISFPNKTDSINRWWHIALVLPVIFFILSVAGKVAVAIPSVSVGFKVSSGPFYIPYSIFLLIYVAISIVALIVKFKTNKGITRDQIYYVLLGASAFAVLALFFSLVMPMITSYENIYRWGIYSVVIFLAFASYAIIERGFLQIKVILTELAVTIVALALLVQTLMSEDINKGLVNGSILVVVIYGGYLIITSVKKEIIQNKQLQNLTHQLEKDKKDLVDLDRMKDEFLQMATHELNTPITVIQGKLNMAVEENLCHLDEEQKNFFKPILTDTMRLAGLSKDILNVSRIDQHRLKVNAAESDLDALIASIVSGFEVKTKEKSNSIAYIKLSKDLPKLTFDQSKIGEVISNLISNANKFTENGKIAVTSKVKDDNVIISVADTGVGIDKDDQKHLFEKFYQVGRFDPENPQEQQGSGLGLYISENIIELHGGKIWLESEKGKGSTFYFSLPLEYKEIKQTVKIHSDGTNLRVL
ncbi:MAG: ATP-binding protein [Patescibacteria group bacterium]